MEPENWQAVIDVHLSGAYNVSRPAFGVMKEKGYGRILMTTSAAGLYGNFGQTNYSAAKMGLVGLKLEPKLVAPMALYLVSERCPVSGNIYNVGMGCFNRAAIVTGPGTVVGDGRQIPHPEQLLAQWENVATLKGAKEYWNATEQIGDVLQAFSKPPEKAGGDMQGFETVNAIFDAMPAAFVAEAAGGVDVVFQFNITGGGGGDWYSVIKDGTCTVEAGSHEKPGCILKMTDADFLNMMNGVLPPMQAYTSGKLVISGDIMKSQLIEKLFKFQF
jgi:putative sterol carrier protein